MRISKTFVVKMGFLDILIIAGILFVAVYVLQQRGEERKQHAMEYHCAAINKDPTRPYLRDCVKPISLEDGFFSFKTKEGATEQYFVIAHKGDVEDIENDVFSYNFIK